MNDAKYIGLDVHQATIDLPPKIDPSKMKLLRV